MPIHHPLSQVHLSQGSGNVNLAFPDPIAEVDKLDWVPYDDPTRYGAMKSIINAEWQYIRHDIYGEELYDLTNDPLEKDNLVAESHTQSILESLRTYLMDVINQSDR
jgi:hypothetical protein